eukprot:963651-Prymnesium_polylepis.1
MPLTASCVVHSQPAKRDSKSACFANCTSGGASKLSHHLRASGWRLWRVQSPPAVSTGGSGATTDALQTAPFSSAPHTATRVTTPKRERGMERGAASMA